MPSSAPSSARHAHSHFQRIILAVLALIAVALCIGTVIALDWYLAYPEDAAEHLEYVGRERCIECHEEEYELWHGSDHDRSMDIATEETVLGDFNNAEFLHIGFDDILTLKEADVKTLLSEADFTTLAIALQGAREGVEDYLRIFMTPEQLKELEQAQSDTGVAQQVGYTPNPKQLDPRIACAGVLRPCDVTTAQDEIDQLLRRLKNEGRISADFGITTRFFKKDGKFFAETDNADGELETFEVQYVFGVRPLQQFLVETERGRLQCLPVAWDTENERWYHLYPKEQILHDDPLHWTGPLQNWNYMCADCHSTNLKKNYDLATDTYHTTWSEIDVSCETCHGPGSLHVELAEANSLFWDRRHGMGLPGLKDAEASMVIESCAPCHSRRRIVKEGPKPPEAPFLDYYRPEMIDNHFYYADGQILDEDYVYTSFKQARMYHEQVRCTDCHDAHSIKVKFDDNRLCTQCHVEAQYDTVTHHHHPDSSQPGTLCVECHMPETTYMVVDPRRDHSIRVPRPDLTLSAGIPNACNGCHDGVREDGTEETPAWADEKCREWYENYPPLDPHFAEGIALGRHGDPDAVPSLLATSKLKELDARPIVRASATALLGEFQTDASEARRFVALEDDDPLVRIAALGSFEDQLHQTSVDLEEMERLARMQGQNAGAIHTARADLERLLKRVAPLLSDDLRAVRIEAARVLAGVNQRHLGQQRQAAFNAAIAEYFESLRAVEDRADSHMNAALIRQALAGPTVRRLRLEAPAAMQDPAAKKKHYQDVREATQEAYDSYHNAVRLNPEFLETRFNLAMLCDERGEKEEAEEHLRKAIEIAESYVRIGIDGATRTLADAYYSLGLVLAENEGKMEEAVAQLKKATDLTGDNPRMFYNYGLALQKLGRYEDADRQFATALRIEPTNPEFAVAPLYSLREQQRWADMATSALTLVPNPPARFPQAEQLLIEGVSQLAAAGEMEEAERVVARALERSPNHPLFLQLQQGLEQFEENGAPPTESP